MYVERGSCFAALKEYSLAVLSFEKALTMQGWDYLEASEGIAKVRQEEKRHAEEQSRIRAEEEAAKRREQEDAHKHHAEREKHEFDQKLQLLDKAAKSGSKAMRTLNQEYQGLEELAIQYKSEEFYISRGTFYDTSAQKEGNATRKEVLLGKALSDYRQAMQIDPFVDKVPECIDAIVAQQAVKPSALPTVGMFADAAAGNPQGFFEKGSGSAAEDQSASMRAPYL